MVPPSRFHALYGIAEASTAVERGVHDVAATVPAGAIAAEVSASNGSDVRWLFPATTRELGLRWLVGQRPERAGAAAEESGTSEDVDEAAASRAGGVVVQHGALHSVGDDVVETVHALRYAFDAEFSSASLSVLVRHAARVTAVYGLGLSTWQSTATGDGILVTAAFRAPTADGASLSIHAESPLVDATVHRLSTVECAKATRQTGVHGVVKLASVEVTSRATRGVVPASPTDVPVALSSQVATPVVLAFKYGAADHEVTLNLLGHAEQATLPAAVERAHYASLVLEDSTVLHSVTLIVQNTAMQYLSIDGVDDGATLWACFVNSVAAKPARDAAGQLLVPLPVDKRVSVELQYLATASAFGDAGEVAFQLPHTKLPIAVYTAELQLPETFVYDFRGNVPRVATLTHRPPRPIKANLVGAAVVEDNFDFHKNEDLIATVLKSAAPAPAAVRIPIPKSGAAFYFERVLSVPGTAPAITVQYAKPEPPPKATWFGF